MNSCWGGLKSKLVCLCKVFLCGILVLEMLVTCSTESHAKTFLEQKKILFISSYSYAWAAVQEQIEGIQRAFDSDAYFLDYEFMDTKKVYDDTSKECFYNLMAHKLQYIGKYDLIITGDDAALEFVMEFREELFQDIPVVFEGINNKNLVDRATASGYAVGLYEELALKENIELGLQIFPESRRVVTIIDNSLTGEAEKANIKACEELFPNLAFMTINGSELTEKELIHELKVLRSDDIVLYIVLSENKDGMSYSDQDAILLLNAYSTAPVFRMMDTGLQQGLLGGYVLSMEQTGFEAGEIGKLVLGGRELSRISAQRCSYVYKINEEVMKQYKINPSRLPKDTVFINHNKSFWEEYEKVIKPGISIFVIIIVALVFSVFDNMKKKRMMKELKEARNIMEDASHHDFLTGLPNRSKFVGDLQELIQSKTPCTVLMLDIDDFKHINDNLGHSAGDEALREIAARMKGMQTNILTPYRYAGDEFIMILRSEQHNLIEKTAYNSRQIFSDKVMLAGEKRVVTGSIGVASYPKDADSLELLITCADDAMYEVKKSGKNKFAYYKGPRKEVSTK